MKKYLFLIFLMPLFLHSQKKKELEIYTSADAKVVMMKAFGDNLFSKNFNPFYGFGFGLNFKTNKKFGLSFEYNKLKSTVKIGKENLVGSLGFPYMTNIEADILYSSKINEEFSVEGIFGMSVYRIKSKFINTSETFNEGDLGFNMGAKGIYSLDRDDIQQVFLGAKFNYYQGKIYNENPEISRFYSRSYFLNLNLGYRYNF